TLHVYICAALQQEGDHSVMATVCRRNNCCLEIRSPNAVQATAANEERHHFPVASRRGGMQCIRSQRVDSVLQIEIRPEFQEGFCHLDIAKRGRDNKSRRSDTV